jgi:hypothetical protein
MSEDQVARLRRRWFVAVAILAVLGVWLAAAYQFVTVADSLHLVVSDSHNESTIVLDVTTHDAARVQRLYTHTLALPGAAGVYSCPTGASRT